MKSILFHTLLAFAMTVGAVPNYVTREITDVQTRDFDTWTNENLLRRYPKAEEYSLEGRDVNENEALGARYLDPFYELTEREYQEIHERQIAQVAKLAVKGIEAIVNVIKGQIEKDKKMRGEWTSHMVGELARKYPHHNFVVCHTEHHYEFKGKRGVDWGHSHQELDVSFHKTIGFEIYWFKEGTFHRVGDGGYLNWAYIGNVIKTSNGGKDVVFGKP